MSHLSTGGTVYIELRVAAAQAHVLASLAKARPVRLRATTFAINDGQRAFIGCLPNAAG